MKRIYAISTLLLLILSCGGGGGDSKTPSVRPDMEITGYAIDANIERGTVTAYAWEGGTKGDILGSAETDEKGYYQITVKTSPKPILLELNGGSYTEESSGETISIKDEVMFAAINLENSDVSVMITPYTTLAVGMAEYHISEGTDTSEAITKSVSDLIDVMKINILEECPLNISEDSSHTDAMTDGHMYGFFCAALSSWAKELSEKNETDIHDTYTSIFITQLLYRDVVLDGTLNGYGLDFDGKAGNLYAGTVAMDSQIYRHKIGHHIIIAAGSNYNRTGLTVPDILDQAYEFSQTLNDMFGYADPLPLDEDGPTVTWTEDENALYSGIAEYGFHISDTAGIKSIKFTLDGVNVDTPTPQGTEENVVVKINTEIYNDGYHDIQLVCSDYFGNEAVYQTTIYINNTQTILDIRSGNSKSDVTVYAFEGEMGDVIAQGQTDNNGSARIEIMSEAKPMMVMLTKGSFTETGTGAQVQLKEGQSLSSAFNFYDKSLTINVTPLTTVAAALSVQHKDSYDTFQEAITAANEKLSKIYQVNILTEQTIDISNSAYATNECTDAYRHSFILAGLSVWTRDAAEQNGSYSQQNYNSILLAEKMAADISNDGLLSGGQSFGSVPINAAVYQTGFGDAILKAIKSQINATKLDPEDFIGTSIEAEDAQQEKQVLGVSFADRSKTINREILSTVYTFVNNQNHTLLFKVGSTGTPSTCKHDYYDAVRIHVIQETKNLDYRARGDNGFGPSADHYYANPGEFPWYPVDEYKKWNGHDDKWEDVMLERVIRTTIDRKSDILPDDHDVAWEYFISATVGETYEANNSCPNDVRGWTYLDYCFAKNGQYDFSPSSRSCGYMYQGIAFGCSNQPPDLSGYTHEPEIQHRYSASYVSIDGPRNETTAEYSDEYNLEGRYVVENEEGGTPGLKDGYYIIYAGGKILVKRYVTTPNIELNSSGQTSYTPTTFDQSLVYNIEKSLDVDLIMGDEDMVGQMPVYGLEDSDNRTYTMSR